MSRRLAPAIQGSLGGPRHILFIDHSGLPGGGQLGLLRYLRQPSDIRRSIIFITGGPVADEVRALGIETRIVFPTGTFTRAHLLRSAGTLRRWVRDLAPDVVVVNSAYAAIPAAAIPHELARKLYYLRTEMVERGRSAKDVIEQAAIYPRFDGFIANSLWTGTTIPTRLKQRPSKVAYPLSGVSREDAKPRPERALRHRGPVTFATFSRLEPWKGVDLALEALEMAAGRSERSIRLDVYGAGVFGKQRYVDSLRARAAEVGFPVHFHGHIREIGSALLATDVLILPSRTPEPFGQVVAQGLSHGCVVVAADHGGVLELVTDGKNALTFEPNSAEDLARRVLQLLAGEIDTDSLLSEAAKTGETMNDRRLAARLEAVIMELGQATSRPSTWWSRLRSNGPR